MQRLILAFLFCFSSLAAISTADLTGTTTNLQHQLDAIVAGGSAKADSIAELLATPSLTNYPVVNVTGYYTPDDGGGALYARVVSSALTNAYGGTLPVGNGISWSLLSPVTSKRFGVKHDGDSASAVNNIAALQAMFTWGHTKGLPMEVNADPNIALLGSGTLSGVETTNQFRLTINGTLKRADNSLATNTSATLISLMATNSPVFIDGFGMIDGNCTNQPASAGNGYAKERGIRIYNSPKALLKDLQVINCGSHAVVFESCEGPRMEGVRIYNAGGNLDPVWGKNSDGAHFYNCNNPSAVGCIIYSTDDCIAVTVNKENNTYTGAIVSGNLLFPTSFSTNNVTSGIRFSMEGGYTNAALNDAIFEGNIIRCRGAVGMLVGATIYRQNTKYHHNIKVRGNLILGSAYDPIPAGPQAGLRLTSATAGMFLVNIDGGEVTDNDIIDSAHMGIEIRNSKNLKLSGGLINNVIDSGVTGASFPYNGGIVIDGYQGDVSEIWIGGGYRISNIDGAGIYAARNPGGFELGVLTGDGLSITNANRSHYSLGYTMASVSLNYCQGFDGNNVTIDGVNSSGFYAMDATTFALRGSRVKNVHDNTNSAVVGYQIRLDSPSANSDPLVKVILLDNEFENYDEAGILVRNPVKAVVEGNRFTLTNAPTASATSAINFLFGSNSIYSSFAPTITIANNTYQVDSGGSLTAVGRIERTTGSVAAPARFYSTEANEGTLTTLWSDSISLATDLNGAKRNVAGDLLPDGNLASSAGSSALRWNYLWADTVIGGSSLTSSLGKHYLRFPDTSASSGVRGLYVEGLYSGSSAVTGTKIGLGVIQRFGGSGGSSQPVVGLDSAGSQDQTSGNVPAVRGVNSLARITGAGTATALEGVRSGASITSSSSTPTMIALRAISPVLSGGGGAGEAAGLYIDAQNIAGVTNAFGVHQIGATDTNSFAGPILQGGLPVRGGIPITYKSGNYTLTTSDCGAMFANTAGATFTLPAGATGLYYRLKCATASGLTIKANGSQQIGFNGVNSTATTGNITTSTNGSTVILIWDGTVWQQDAYTGTWTVN